MGTLAMVGAEKETGDPAVVMVFDDTQAALVNEDGELPDTELEEMRGASDAEESLSYVEAFDRYCNAHGLNAQPPQRVDAADFPSAVQMTVGSLGTAYGSGDAARQARLRQIAATYRQRFRVDPDAYSEADDAVGSGWDPAWAQRTAKLAGLTREYTEEQMDEAAEYLTKWPELDGPLEEVVD